MSDLQTALAYDAGLNAGLDHAAKLLAMSDQTIRLHAGELTGSEMRAVCAVLAWIGREIQGMKT